ncbi:Na/Pi cotransporter family protein [Paenirhodobacter populi]|uniref:Na/Pi cotransporter family protein n=1 Tax=Paenirhodobacter populi TaxID=2306993 RepID=UPI000FE3D5C2|nr:Na/Pi cotransporter family protein [Sinirhodobacter populi]RWR09454.1 Na/Pi cotransporter family protein [Sinirhodobacter populi]
MQSILVFLQMAGAVALLLFGLRLVREGVTEAFGMRLRMILGRGTKSGIKAFCSGLVATLGLQSSTATALMTASFVEREMIPPRMAQIVLLGANVGTALTAVLVAAGMQVLAPVLILVGYLTGRRKGPAWGGGGRALIGLGLMLLSLGLLDIATEPLRDAPALAAFLSLLDGAWPVAAAVAAVLAVICSSSLAVVMLVLSLSLPPDLAVAMVLGANVGGAVTPVLATAAAGVAARRVAVGNLLVRAIGVLVALPFCAPIGAAMTALPLRTGLAVEFHLLFNLALAALVWPFVGRLATFIARMLPEQETPGEIRPQWLDDSALETPTVALAGASREALAIGDLVERMMQQTQIAFQKNDAAPLAEVGQLEERVDRLQQEVKAYLSRLGRAADDEDRRRAIVILDYVINLEHIGDIIDKGLAPEVRKKVGLRLRFSDEGYAELNTMFLMTLENLRVGQTIFMTRDRTLARRMMEVKVDIRKLERLSSQRHLMRLREGHSESQQTSSLHLDMLRDLKRVNAHIVSVAHPILDEEGLLIESRLKKAPQPAPT